MMKVKNLQPRLLYPARSSFKYEGEIKSFIAAIAATGGKIVSKLRKVTVLLYSDKARVHQRCCLNGNEFIFREQWQSSASHWESDQQSGEARKPVNVKTSERTWGPRSREKLKGIHKKWNRHEMRLQGNRF